MYKYIFFDLDGTIVNSESGILNALRYSLNKFGISNPEYETIIKFIGPPLRDSYMNYYGFNKEQADQGVVYYREYYSKEGIFEANVYDGIEDLLKYLKEHNYKIVLATSKPDEFAKIILEHFGLLKYFDFVAGATMSETRTNKEEVLQYALDENNILDVSSVLMIGDRKFDILGAKKFDIDSVGVLYGFGNREEFENAGANYIVESPMEIIEKVLYI